MANTGKVLPPGEPGIAEEYAPLPSTNTLGQPKGILIRPPTALLLAVLVIGAVVGAYTFGRSSVAPQTASPAVGPAPSGAGGRVPRKSRESGKNNARQNPPRLN